MTPAVSRFLALLVLLLLLAPLTFIGIRVFGALSEQREAITTAQDQLERLEAAASVTLSPEDLTVLRTFSGRTLLGKAQPPILAAALQERLRSLAQNRGITVVQASEVSSPLSPPLNRVGLKLDVSGRERDVLDLAEEIENLEPWLRIETVTLRSGFIDTSGQQQEPLLTASLEIWGHASAGEAR